MGEAAESRVARKGRLNARSPVSIVVEPNKASVLGMRPRSTAADACAAFEASS